MPKALSEDLRKRVVEARLSGMSVSEVCLRFSVDDNSVYRWVKQYEESGSLSSRQGSDGRPCKIQDMARFEAFVQVNAHCTLKQMAQRWEDEVSVMCISRALKRLGWTRKKSMQPTGNVMNRSVKYS